MNEADPGAACARPEVGALLARYEFGGLAETERIAFERHVLECNACFEELERGAAVASELRARPAKYLGMLEEARRGTKPSLAPAPRRPAFFGRIVRGRLAVPAVAVLVVGLATATWLARGPGEARYAAFPHEAMSSDAVRAPGTASAVRELMASGAAYFDLGRYDEAARRFRAAREREPSLAEAAYALGLSMALAGDARGAIPHLENAIQLATPELRDKSRWVLANACLRAGDGAAARRELASLADGSGGYAVRARELAARLGR